MVVNTPYDVQDEYVTQLRAQLTDPNSTRLGKGLEWIYDDIPKARTTQAYPRISVLQLTNPAEAHALGSKKDRITVNLLIQIRVARQKFDSKSPPQFLGEIESDVIEAIRTDAFRESLRTNAGVFNIRLVGDQTIPTDEVLIREIQIENIMER